MSYEYTDRDGDKLEIQPTAQENFDCVYIDVAEHGFFLKPEDAPAVALALLEASGLHESNTDVCLAASELITYNRKRAEQAAREAEDAKVREFHRLTTRFAAASDSNWPMLTEDRKNKLRAQYRAAREFFTGADDGTDYHRHIAHDPAHQEEPRVLNYGDPEPARGTKWRDSAGGIVRYFPKDAGWGNTCGRVWEGLGSHWFPMTEVAGE